MQSYKTRVMSCELAKFYPFYKVIKIVIKIQIYRYCTFIDYITKSRPTVLGYFWHSCFKAITVTSGHLLDFHLIWLDLEEFWKKNYKKEINFCFLWTNNLSLLVLDWVFENLD